LQEKYSKPNIVIIGDFNDQPTDESISLHLGATEYSENNLNINENQIYNLSFSVDESGPGNFEISVAMVCF
jgi:hypothetical protein